MAVLNTQAVLDAIGLIVGGTQPDATNNPGFWSGYTVGDSTGISGVHGAYSRPPEVTPEPPVCIILAGDFQSVRGVPEVNRDLFRLVLLVDRNDAATQYPNLVPFRDLFPDAFDAKMTLNATTLVLEAHIDRGRPGVSTWAGQEYFSWEFILRVDRDPIKQYIA